MLESIYSGVSAQGTTFELESFLICSGVSLLLGLAIAYIYRFRNPASKNFMVTLALLPVMVLCAWAERRSTSSMASARALCSMVE